MRLARVYTVKVRSGEILDQLRKLDIPYNVRVAPEIELRQVEVFYPEGNMFEVLVKGDEAEGIDVPPYKWKHRL